MVFGLFAKKIPYDAVAGAEKFKKTVLSLAVNPTREAPFNLQDQNHLDILKNCTASVNQHLPVLQSRDIHIAIGFGVAVGALILSAFVPFGLTIALAGVAYGAYFLGGRDEPYNKFNAALEELAHCCDWALSDIMSTDKFKNDDIKAMLKTLAPLVTKEDLVIIMGSDDEANRVIKALEDLSAQELLDHEEAISNQTPASPLNLPKPVPYKLATKHDINYNLYGYKQGGSLLTLANVATIYFQKAFTYIWNLIAGANKTPDDANNAPPVTTPRI